MFLHHSLELVPVEVRLRAHEFGGRRVELRNDFLYIGSIALGPSSTGEEIRQNSANTYSL